MHLFSYKWGRGNLPAYSHTSFASVMTVSPVPAPRRDACVLCLVEKGVVVVLGRGSTDRGSSELGSTDAELLFLSY